MIPRIYQPDTPAAERAGENFAPPAEAMIEMGKFNEELKKAGALIDLEGLHPISKGARVRFANGKPSVTDGPFIESKEVVGGFWLIQTKSKDEAIEWFRRCPADNGDVIEIRQIFEMSDLPPDVQKAANATAEK
ncbi:MAG: YciI family protein [Limisphaerales bacterium]